MAKDPIVYLLHINDSIVLIGKYINKINKKEFLSDPILQDAVMRRLEIIGEAVKNLPVSFKSKHKSVPWKKIAGMRDILIHEYFGVDLNLVWNTLKTDLSKFQTDIVKLIQANKQPPIKF